MLSNLVMRGVDEQLTGLADKTGFTYTRYADDLAFSTTANINLEHVEQLKRSVLSTLAARGFAGNRRKTVIRGPGARRIVLGVLVDGPEPRLARDARTPSGSICTICVPQTTARSSMPTPEICQYQLSFTTCAAKSRGRRGWNLRSVAPVWSSTVFSGPLLMLIVVGS